ncbi:hypothetical protein L7F22_002596 [Adiantum nelumboides]|nr:hypothetical protein [Adiantum nelumboides]
MLGRFALRFQRFRILIIATWSFEHPSASRMVMRLALKLAGKSYGLLASSNTSRITIRLVDGCSTDPRCVFSALNCVKLQRGAYKHSSASRMVSRLALELAGKSYDLLTSSNVSRITKRLADACSEDLRCVFSALNCVKLQRGPSKHSSASHMVSRIALELADKSYDLLTSSNASRITKRLADGCSKDPRCVFNALDCVKLQRGPSKHSSSGPVKWGEFASEVVKNVTNEGHLDRKREQWKLETSQVSTRTPSGSAILLVNTPSGSTPAGSGLFATTQSAFSVEVSTSLQELLVEVTKSHDNVLAECQKAKDYVVKSVADVHRCEGALETIQIHFPDYANVPTSLLDILQETFDQENATLQQAQDQLLTGIINHIGENSELNAIDALVELLLALKMNDDNYEDLVMQQMALIHASTINGAKAAFYGRLFGKLYAQSYKLLDLRFYDFNNDKTNLKGKTLSAALMSDAKFDGADMIEVTMSKAYAVGAIFKGADFTNAILDHVVFDGSNLQATKFKNVVLSGSTFVNAKLEDSNFEDALIGYVDLQKFTSCVREEWMNRVRANLEDKAATFTQALVNEALVSHLEDLENADDEEEDDDEDKKDQAGTSRHPGLDDDNDDDQDQPRTGPSSGGATTNPPPPPLASQSNPLVPKDNEPEHRDAIGTIGEGKLQLSTKLLTYKKRSIALSIC